MAVASASCACCCARLELVCWARWTVPLPVDSSSLVALLLVLRELQRRLSRRHLRRGLVDLRQLQGYLGVLVGDIGLRLGDGGLALRQSRPVVALVDPHQHLAGRDGLVVGDLERRHIAADLGADGHIVGLQVGVVGAGEIAQRGQVVPAEAGQPDQQHRDDQHRR